MHALADRPPYIRFEKRAIATAEIDKVSGLPVTVDVDMVFVTSPGSKDEWEGIAKDWFDRKAQEARALPPRFNPQWLQAFKDAYAAWQRDEEPPVMGTHISKWPGLSKAQFETLRHARVLTIEDVAAMNEDTMMRVGMGARSLKQRAENFLENARAAIPAERLSALQLKVDEQSAIIQRQEVTIQGLNAALRAQAGAQAPQPVTAEGLGLKL